MPELRRDPITGSWVILAPDQPIHPPPPRAPAPARSPASCPLCPGNEAHTPAEVYALRPGGGPAAQRNAPGWSLRVVPHKFPVLRIEGDLGPRPAGIYDRMNGIGAHEILVETPDHQRQLQDLGEPEIEQVLWAYRHRILDLRRDERFRYIQVSKTHGAPGGAVLTHAHSQIFALPVLPPDVAERVQGARRYHEFHGRCPFCDMVHQEVGEQKRVIYENSAVLVLAPYASRVPFETWIVPKNHRPSFEDAPAAEYAAMAGALRVTLRKLFRALDDPCYSFTLHNAPFADRPSPCYHWHIAILPVVGQGVGDGAPGLHVNPTPPEEAAHYLRGLPV